MNHELEIWHQWFGYVHGHGAPPQPGRNGQPAGGAQEESGLGVVQKVTAKERLQQLL